MIIVSDAAVNLLMTALTGKILGVRTEIDAGVLVVGVNVNVFSGIMTAFEFVMSLPLEGVRC